MKMVKRNWTQKIGIFQFNCVRGNKCSNSATSSNHAHDGSLDVPCSFHANIQVTVTRLQTKGVLTDEYHV